MYRPALVLTAALLLAGPALAQNDIGNAEQPSRPVPQTGQTSGGPAETPATPDLKAAPGVAPAPGSSTGAADSAKGGNAAETNKPVPNTGGTSGGPAR